MEKISNEEKKKLFMALVNQYTNRFDLGNAYHQKEGDAMYEAGYWNNDWKIKNNSVLGLHYDGITEDGKRQVGLEFGGALGEGGYGNIRGYYLKKQFDDENQMYEFLDRFLDMNNMEALNEFGPENKGFQEYEKYEGAFTNDMHLEYLYLLDCINEKYDLNQEGLYEATIRTESGSNGDIHYYPTYGAIGIDLKNEGAEFDLKNWESYKTEIFGDSKPSHEFQEYIELCQKAISNFPDVYKDLRNGTYSKEKYMSSESPIYQEDTSEKSNFEINEYGEIIRPNNKTTLQQKEEELAALEKESKTISEAEALIDRQNEGQNIGE